MPKLRHFMSVRFNYSTRAEVLRAIEESSTKHTLQIATINPEFILEAEHNTGFREALSNMTHSIVDGSGLYFMMNLHARFTGEKRVELYHGSDLVADLFRRYQDGSKTFYFIGGPPHHSEQAAEALRKKYPHLEILGATDGGKIDADNVTVADDIYEDLKKLQPDIVLVGFGAPKQELWIQKAKEKLSIPVMAGIGGSLGFYISKPRAPKIVRKLHLEWLHRSLTEPGHYRRAYRAVVTFSIQALGWISAHRSKTS